MGLRHTAPHHNTLQHIASHGATRHAYRYSGCCNGGLQRYASWWPAQSSRWSIPSSPFYMCLPSPHLHILPVFSASHRPTRASSTNNHSGLFHPPPISPHTNPLVPRIVFSLAHTLCALSFFLHTLSFLSHALVSCSHTLIQSFQSLSAI